MQEGTVQIHSIIQVNHIAKILVWLMQTLTKGIDMILAFSEKDSVRSKQILSLSAISHQSSAKGLVSLV